MVWWHFNHSRLFNAKSLCVRACVCVCIYIYIYISPIYEYILSITFLNEPELIFFFTYIKMVSLISI